MFKSIKKCLSSKDNQEILRCKIDGRTDVDMIKLFVWLSQNVFNRRVDQEKNEIKAGQKSKETLEKFFIATKNFGLIDEMQPSADVINTTS